MKKTVAIAALLLAAGATQGAIRFSEIFQDAPGTDNGQEFIELCGDANESLAGLWLLAIEGDGASPGVVDQAINLGAFSLGSNGLFLRRDSATTLDTSSAAGVQGPDANTTVSVLDFSPDIENGSTSYLLVSGFTGAIGSDIDANNDGVADATFWAFVVDALGIIENDGAQNVGYGDDFGSVNLGPYTAFNADAAVLGADGVWYAADVLGTSPGFYTFDALENTFASAPTADDGLTPGVKNTIPTPGATALALLGGLVATRRRRNR